MRLTSIPSCTLANKLTKWTMMRHLQELLALEPSHRVLAVSALVPGNIWGLSEVRRTTPISIQRVLFYTFCLNPVHRNVIRRRWKGFGADSCFKNGDFYPCWTSRWGKKSWNLKKVGRFWWGEKKKDRWMKQGAATVRAHTHTVLRKKKKQRAFVTRL